MFELVVVLTLICLLLVIKIIFDRFDKEHPPKKGSKDEAEDGKDGQNKPREFKGVVITPGEDCCHSVLMLQNQTFTGKDNISLPLPDCSKEKCSCERTIITERRKRHRRQTADRRTAIRFEPDFNDRRQKGGRRKEDDNTFTGGYRH